jgi:hypothetical protein
VLSNVYFDTNEMAQATTSEAPGDVRDTHSTAVGEEMQPAGRGVPGISTATFFQGTEAGAQTSSALSHNPYGLCTPRRVLTPLTHSRTALVASDKPSANQPCPEWGSFKEASR